MDKIATIYLHKIPVVLPLVIEAWDKNLLSWEMKLKVTVEIFRLSANHNLRQTHTNVENPENRAVGPRSRLVTLKVTA